MKTISRVRKRFVTEGIEASIEHRPQPARPDKIKIKGNVEQKFLLEMNRADALAACEGAYEDVSIPQ